ncbi:MAG TPA: hypothetical protein VNK49_08760 [Anaerolineales bacterium]|nr:hypothetical protein [Anaerolineales bacterium]
MTYWLAPSSIHILASFSDLNLLHIIAQTLLRRGIHTPDTADAFLHPDFLFSTSFPNIEPVAFV